jgi:hypothetical protein
MKIGYNVRVWEEAPYTIWRQAAAVTIQDSVVFEETHSLLRTTTSIKTASVNLALRKIRSQIINDKNEIHSFTDIYIYIYICVCVCVCVCVCSNLVQCGMLLTLRYI